LKNKTQNKTENKKRLQDVNKQQNNTKKNSFVRVLHSLFEAGNTYKFLNVKGLENLRTHTTWYLPYTKESFQQLKTLFPELKIIIFTEKDEQNTIVKAKNN